MANCCSQVSPDKFQLIAANIPVLAQRLTMQDKKSVDAVCLCFTRLVDNFQADPTKLREIACDGLLENFKQLVVVYI